MSLINCEERLDAWLLMILKEEAQLPELIGSIVESAADFPCVELFSLTS